MGVSMQGQGGSWGEAEMPAFCVAAAVPVVALLWWRRSQTAPSSIPDATVTLIIPTFNEEKAILPLMQHLSQLQPAVHQVLVADGNSGDRTVSLAEHAGATVVHCTERGRSRQMNAAAEFATGDILCFVHADSAPPLDLVAIIRRRLAHRDTVLGGFRTVIDGSDGVSLRFMTWHHLVKTYYLPAIARPLSFLRGLLCLFGDQTLFCRTADFRAVGGYDPELPIMEDVDFCIRLHEAGPSSYRAESPIGPHPLTAVPSPAGDGPRERAAGASSSREQSNTEGAPLAQGYMPREEDTSSQVASSSSDPPPLRQRRQTSVAASLAGGGRSGAGTSDSSPTSRLAGWLAALQVWAMSHCRRRGRVRMEWQPVAHTSGRRLQAWGNFKATKIHFVLGLAWYLRVVTPKQLVSLYHSMYTDDYR